MDRHGEGNDEEEEETTTNTGQKQLLTNKANVTGRGLFGREPPKSERVVAEAQGPRGI